MAGSDLDFHFFSRDIAIFGELSHFFTFGCWVGLVPYLELFWAGPVKKTRPVSTISMGEGVCRRIFYCEDYPVGLFSLANLRMTDVTLV